MKDGIEARQWAWGEFGGAGLGHARRVRRLVSMAAGAAEAPGGKISQVYATDAERQGAYDLLEESTVSVQDIQRACVQATIERCAAHPYVFVAVDGSSLTITDRKRIRELGTIGSRSVKTRGLKVITAYAIDPAGVPLGITAQTWWARTQKPAKSPLQKRKRNAKRPTAKKETQHWLDTCQSTIEALQDQGPRPWFQLDREGDNAAMLQMLVASGHDFTVRGNKNRRLAGESTQYLRNKLQRQRVLGSYELNVVAGHKRAARQAKMAVRACRVSLRIRHPWTHATKVLTLTAVLTREVSRVPAGEEPIDWLLFTNREVKTFEEASLVIHGYSLRWRIEELHKTWKSGGCHVEETQLHSQAAIIKWATILVAVATRIERLKLLSRESPQSPASQEFSPIELQALVLLKHRQKKRTEHVHDNPTLGEAVRWLADLGGYTGKSSGGPPGTITIGRGFARVLIAVDVLTALKPRRRAK